MFLLAPDLVNILITLASPLFDAICRRVSPFCSNKRSVKIHIHIILFTGLINYTAHSCRSACADVLISTSLTNIFTKS